MYYFRFTFSNKTLANNEKNNHATKRFKKNRYYYDQHKHEDTIERFDDYFFVKKQYD